MMDADILMILAPAFIAGAIISLAHVPLGIEVLKRGIIFLDLAVAQFAALGMTIFHVFFENHGMAPQYAAAGSLISGLTLALICALGLHMMEKQAGRYHEAIIGSAFIFAASMGILLMAGDPHSGEQMKDILAGQILWITWQDLMLYGPVFVIVAGLWFAFKNYREKLFYVLFALTIPFSVNLIGVYLVFASLILPALATVKLGKHRILASYVISIASFALGLMVSYLTDTPAGSAIVVSMFTIIIACYGLNKFLVSYS